MLRMLRNGLLSTVAFNAEGGGGGGGNEPPKEPESILFPKENDKPTDPPAGDAPKLDADGKPIVEPPKETPKLDADGKPIAEWKEYVADPAKSDAENAAAKVEHDKAKPADDGKKGDTVPADGKYTLAMPEGVPLDQELVDALGPDFKEVGLTNAQAQKLADRFIEVQKKRAEKTAGDIASEDQAWIDEAKADKEIGGTKWDGTVAAGRRAVETLGTPKLRAFLNASGGGNHPEVIRFMAKVGAMIKEDDPANGGAGGSGRRADPAYVLFPHDVPKGT